jgi:hypothetical protein
MTNSGTRFAIITFTPTITLMFTGNNCFMRYELYRYWCLTKLKLIHKPKLKE